MKQEGYFSEYRSLEKNIFMEYEEEKVVVELR
jgi:hypothetical protein